MILWIARQIGWIILMTTTTAVNTDDVGKKCWIFLLNIFVRELLSSLSFASWLTNCNAAFIMWKFRPFVRTCALFILCIWTVMSDNNVELWFAKQTNKIQFSIVKLPILLFWSPWQRPSHTTKKQTHNFLAMLLTQRKFFQLYHIISPPPVSLYAIQFSNELWVRAHVHVCAVRPPTKSSVECFLCTQCSLHIQ